MPVALNRPCFAAFALLLLVFGAAAQEPPRVAGSEGVPVPKRTKMVKPEYPSAAQAQGLRGIVILDLTIDALGKVVQVDLIRSIPGLDEAAVAAVRQWEYEPVKVGGKPVPVKLTVPITFLMQLPEVNRQAGIPELRQGAAPAVPKGAESIQAGSATAEVSIDVTGRVVEAAIRAGDPPFTEALLQALRTWVFAADEARGPVAFKVQADFIGGDERRRVVLNLTDLHPAPPPSEPAQAAPGATKPPGAGGGSTEPPPVVASTGRPTPEPAPPTSSPALEPEPGNVPPAPAARLPPPSEKPPLPAPPPVEILKSPVEAPKAPEPGISALRDVILGPGVPELLRGRRPVPPPLARMAGVTGAVLVRFAVDAGGAASVQGVEGPELLRAAAEQAVASWVFRRTTTDRLRAVAEFRYRDDGAAASVRLEP